MVDLISFCLSDLRSIVFMEVLGAGRKERVLKADLNFFLLQMSQEESTRFYDQLNHHIFELVSSSDANERKGGILAIGE